VEDYDSQRISENESNKMNQFKQIKDRNNDITSLCLKFEIDCFIICKI